VLAERLWNHPLFAAGGWVLVAIGALSVAMWVLILDRYWFFWRGRPACSDAALARWRAKRSGDPLVNRRLRAGLAHGFTSELSHWIGTIQVIAAVLPLLGLLGTVIGMIKTFEVMTVFGTGNVRGMAEGISQALITTMAGLVTAISGLYFANNLEQRVELERERLLERLAAEPERAP